MPPTSSTNLYPKSTGPSHGSAIRSPSPNYFAFPIDSSNTTVHSAGSFRHKHWDVVDSGIRSAAAISPQSMPVLAEKHFDGIKEAADRHPPFRLGSRTSSAQAVAKHTSPKQFAAPVASPPHPPQIPFENSATRRVANLSVEEPFGTSRSPKRLLSADANTIFDRPRRGSPVTPTEHRHSRSNGSPPLRPDERHLHISSVRMKAGPPEKTLGSTSNNAAPSNPTGDYAMIFPHEAYELLEEEGDDILVLDLRVSTQYSRSHLKGSLNLCVPTTLLKRPSYTAEKLADTFRSDPRRKQIFARWRTCRSIMVYDASATQPKEAAGCVNILRKFDNEGFHGKMYILCGGFRDFAQQYPTHVECGDDSPPAPGSPDSGSAFVGVAPVIGGCPIPSSDNAVNPFFSNIRQNMDLIGGVGQLAIHRPNSLNAQNSHSDLVLPKWLARASNRQDNGRLVANKFLHIEQQEQKRMQEALSAHNRYMTNDSNARQSEIIRIAGLEKGAKNRYNNIWPFEHSRVKLKGVPNDGCDYVNANFIRTSKSHKRYIATQGPIPATFADFWTMVWQRDVRVIVMLTAETEAGQIKAHNYWSGKHHGPIRIQLHSEHRATLDPSRIVGRRSRPQSASQLDRNTTKYPGARTSTDKGDNRSAEDRQRIDSSSDADEPFVIVRKFTISHDASPFERMREVTQLQYSGWPDFGAPAHPAHLLGLVAQCNAVIETGASSDRERALHRPVLAHCSAGCGRTGTFCTVDTVIDLLKQQIAKQEPGVDSQRTNSARLDSTQSAGGLKQGVWLNLEDTDLIEQTVMELRLQRLSMVQSLRQFVLCYETVLEWLARQQ